MLTKFVPELMFFYLQGREADKPRGLKLDLEEIAEKALAGPDDVHTVIRAAVDLAMKPLEQGAKRREWIADNEEDIFAAGGDGDAAYAHFLQGRIDEHTYKITNPVLDAMIEVSGGDDEEEEDEEEDGDGDEDENPSDAEGAEGADKDDDDDDDDDDDGDEDDVPK